MPEHTKADIKAWPRTSEEVEHVVVMERLQRYNRSLPCGAGALHRHLQAQALLHPMPSVSQIANILTQYALTHGRTGWYEGEKLDWLPASAHVPVEQRKHFSMSDCCQR